MSDMGKLLAAVVITDIMDIDENLPNTRYWITSHRSTETALSS